jgi:HJR/Mrr/RecB family endonuclease
MSGVQFELYVAGLLRAMGHTTRVLGGSGDQGVDLSVDYFGERVAVQCKNYAKLVGNRPVQEDRKRRFYELRLLGRYSVSKKIEYPQFVHAA